MLRVRFNLFYKLNLLEALTIRGEAVGSFDKDDRSRFGLSPAIELDYERLRQCDLNDRTDGRRGVGRRAIPDHRRLRLRSAVLSL